MNACKIMLFLIPAVYSSFCSADNLDRMVFNYDKSSSEIYVNDGGMKKIFKFEADYTGNPSYSFDFFF